MRTIREATGSSPMIVRHKLDFGTSFIVVRGTADPQRVPARLREFLQTPPMNETMRMPTDDWPFLYIKPGTVPFGYLAVLMLIGALAVVAIRRAYGGTSGLTTASFDWTMFFMGAGFMLLETRMVTALSLLFGSTWIVNAFVFGGVLTMVLLANLWVIRFRPSALGRWFVPLLATVALTWIVGAGALSGFSITTRGILGGLLFALPIGFAGVIVATLLARSETPSLSLGANLIGGVLGGILEYSSMFFGLRFVGVLSLLCYLAAFQARRFTARESAGT
jgi:hypothetical protein